MLWLLFYPCYPCNPWFVLVLRHCFALGKLRILARSCPCFVATGKEPAMASSPAIVQPLLAPPIPVNRPQSRTSRQLGLPRLSVVIVNYRQWEQTAELVRQLLAATCVR